MNRNSAELTLQETDTTDCSCMQLYSRNNKHNQTTRFSTLRSHQSHPRVNTCARCRKKKTGNPKNSQHCPSCLCPPDVVRSSSGRLRGAENMEDVLSRFEEITRDPRENGLPHESMHNARGTLVNGKSVPIKSGPKKSSTNAIRQQQRKNDHDQVLNALYQDLMSSGLATEETQNSKRYQLQQGPIKSVRNRKSNLIRTEQSPAPSGICNQESLDLDSDAVLRYFRDYKNPKNPKANHKSGELNQIVNQQQRCDSNKQQEDIGSNFEATTSKLLDAVDDKEKRQFERDKRELKELSKEVRDFEINKIKDFDDGSETRWDKFEKTLPRGAGDDQTKRKVSFLPSKLPVPMFPGNVSVQNNRSRSPSAGGDQIDKVIETRTGNNSTSVLDINCHEEREESPNRHLIYSNKDSGNSSLKNPKDNISYCHNAPYRSSSAPVQHASETEEQTEATVTRGINGNQERCSDQLPTPGLSKKHICGGGDLDLHASKSYIVDLIDRALSRELGTVPEDKKKVLEPAVHPSQSQKEICVEIARALQADGCSTLASNQNGNVYKEAPEYVRHLKVLRWDYLNHIQDELKKLQDLERILDTYSPRQSSLTVPVKQFQPSTSEQKKNQQSIF